MRINIWGCGYIGTLSSVYFASLGHDVIGIEIDSLKLSSLKKGKAPFSERGVNDLLRRYISAGNLHFKEVGFDNADLDVVCVATPNSENGELSMRYIDTVSREIYQLNSQAHIVIRSTIPVSYDEELRKKYSKGAVSISLFPEFLREGNAVEDTFIKNQLIIGCAQDKRSCFENLLAKDKREIFFVSSEVAGSIKMVNNSWHATKIAFVNEVARLFSHYNVDYSQLLEVFRQDEVLNLGKAYLKPGFAFGGSCLPKDSRGMSALAARKNIRLPMVDQVNESNAEHLLHISNNIIKLLDDKEGIIVCGLSFKEGTNDLRNSPTIELLQLLESKVRTHIIVKDDSLDSKELYGENSHLWNRFIRHFEMYDSNREYRNYLIVCIHQSIFNEENLFNCTIVDVLDLI